MDDRAGKRPRCERLLIPLFISPFFLELLTCNVHVSFITFLSVPVAGSGVFAFLIPGVWFSLFSSILCVVFTSCRDLKLWRKNVIVVRTRLGMIGYPRVVGGTCRHGFRRKHTHLSHFFWSLIAGIGVKCRSQPERSPSPQKCSHTRMRNCARRNWPSIHCTWINFYQFVSPPRAAHPSCCKNPLTSTTTYLLMSFFFGMNQRSSMFFVVALFASCVNVVYPACCERGVRHNVGMTQMCGW